MSDAANLQYLAMQYRNASPLESVKEYTGVKWVKNYTLRPDRNACTLHVPDDGPFDLVMPLDIMRTTDILRAVQDGRLAYGELHFLTVGESG
jgi:hypothetical protein